MATHAIPGSATLAHMLVPGPWGKEGLIWLGAFCTTVCAIYLTYQRSFVFDRPIQSSIVSLTVAGLCIYLLHGFAPKLLLCGPRPQEYSAVPLDDPRRPQSSREPSSEPEDGAKPLGPSVRRFLLASAVGGVCLRVEVFRHMMGCRQCASPGVESFGVVLLACYGYWRIQRPRRKNAEPSADNTRGILSRRLVTYGPIVPSILLHSASALTASLASAERSTYICPVALNDKKLALLLQYLAVCLDCVILTSIAELTGQRRKGATARGRNAPFIVGVVFLLSATVLSFAGFVVFLAKPEYRSWILGVDDAYVRDLARQTVLFTALSVCAVQVSRFIGPLELVMIVVFLYTYMSGFEAAWAGRSPYYPAFPVWNATALVLLFSGTLVFFISGTASGGQGSLQATRSFFRTFSWQYALLIILFSVPIFLDASRNNAISKHPIDTLMKEAYEQHQAWVKQASTYNTLQHATDEYRRRYKRHPPPNFDEWYNYATSRSSLIIDDYDSIYEDLLPFWASDPLTLRTRTREMILDPWNEVAEVSIRNGKAEIGPNVLPTHRWMLDGVLAMLNDFVQWLPDMDLAFNINDEPRVAIPYETLETLKAVGEGAGSLDRGKSNDWSSNRADTWSPINETIFVQSRFEDHSFQNTFSTYGSIACPPSSQARLSRIWDQRTHCTSCISPHSLGPFLRNWTLAALPCHQPDLANLHGFYLSPAAFKPTHDPLPVFSQSKPHGYTDILYPSPWNYMDKVQYAPSDTHPDPPFADKENTLFWRGATSEGVSTTGSWKGMARQRLVHLLTNSTAPVPVLLPSPPSAPLSPHTKYTTQSLEPRQLRALGLHADVAFVETIARCGGRIARRSGASSDSWAPRIFSSIGGIAS
ncbi:MAG: hypothetical protein FRX48_01059 [Lasallia pustulata]|uniref:Glycosyl transferase CAP10 domain-containing protein n=1 Tax=Lasallia pustulata TaxID=136370 RepID=A0A5M8Q5G0_9LECA|nr:MAG: hypothetical protein FRX48_01059 [Lasallia pustulata]